MKQYLLTIIAVLAAIILALSSIETEYSDSRYVKGHCRSTGIRHIVSAGADVPVMEDVMTPVVGANNHSPLREETVSVVVYDEPTIPSETRHTASLHHTSMQTLSPSELPPLDAGMVNVTYGTGYRVAVGANDYSPLHTNELQITIPYDPELLPQGFTEDDIQTYVYDRQYHRWVAIQRDSVNEAELLVCSRFRPWEKGLPHTQNDMVNPQDALAQVQDMMSFASQGEGGGDSPLDFINAVLKTPEMPETSAYTPTSIKELKAADPLEGLTLMQPPTANNSGTANLSYPIEIPAGRQGMQPNLALTYSSGGGNGWLGVGWDISIPSITVETRWGVPRYDSYEESEVYVYEGEQLVSKDANGEFRKMRHRTNEFLQRQSGHVQFYPRKNEAFDSIVRHGDSPSNYWWSVTHKNGVTDYYGKYASDNGVNNSCVLRTGADNTYGAIAHWALAESVDPNGNSVRYYYDTVFENNNDGDIIGKQIYIDRITYTNTLIEQGKYKIVFNRQDGDRQDVIINANRGFAEITAANLCNIGISYNDTTIREYMFFNTLGRCSNYKTVLKDIVRVDRVNLKPLGCVEKIQELTENNITLTHFDYYEAPESSNMFTNEQSVILNDDTIKSWFISNPADLGNDGKSTALGSTRGKSWNAGGTASVGLGANVALSSLSVGGNFNYSRSKSEGALTLIDLDGDGLADKVFKNSGKLFYRPQIAITDSTFKYGDVIPILGVTDFLKDVSSTTSWGLQASAGLAYNGSWPTTKSTTSIYFSDVNADGLPDLITDNGVMFNTTEAGGTVKFNNFYTMITENFGNENSLDSNLVLTPIDSCQGIIFDGEANDSIICFVTWIYDTSFNSKNYYDGYIPQQVRDFVDSLNETGEYYCEYRHRANPPRITDIFVFKKDVECIPIFEQKTNSTIVSIPDPDMETVKVWVPQKEGSTSIRSYFQLLNDSVSGMTQSKWRDGVSYSVQICRNVNVGADYRLYSEYYDTLFTEYVDKNDFSVKDTTFSVNLGLNDIVFFRLISGNNHDFDKVNWRQTITYSGNRTLDKYGVNENYYDSKRDFVVSGRDFFAVPLNEDSSYIRVSADIYTTTPYSNDLHSGYRLRIEALRTNTNNSNTTTIAKKNESIRNNTPHTQIFLTKNNSQYIPVQQEDFVKFTLEKKTRLTSQQFDWSEVQIVPRVEYYLRQNGRYVLQQEYYPPVKAEIENYDGTKKDTVYHNLFGPLYRGWGQFAYNNNDTANGTSVHDSYIQVDKLVVDMEMYPNNDIKARKGENKIKGFKNNITKDTLHPQESTDMISTYENSEMFNPIAKTTSWIEMRPDCKNRAWVGYGNINYLTDNIMSNTRLPEYSADTNTIDIEEYDHPIPILDNHQVKTVRKQNISKIKNHSLSFAPVPIISVGNSYSNGENIILTDYMDLNGDRYPDIVGQSMVQYSNPWGGIGKPVALSSKEGGITKSKTNSEGETFGGSFQMPTRGVSNNPKGAKISFDGSGNIGADLGGGTDKTIFSWMDINGDGLPDKVLINNQGYDSVCLNTGYRFEPAINWGNFSIRNGESTNKGFSFGGNFNVGQASLGGGLGVNYSDNHTNNMLMDFNGDGLPDLVKKTGNNIEVRYNIGGGNWSVSENIDSISYISLGRSYSESINASATFGFTFFSILKICVGVSGSPYNKTFSKDRVQLTDINGDGYVDYVTSDSESKMTIRYNKSGKTNLLRKVTNFTGSSIELDYDMPLACFNKPQRSWNLARVETYNNVANCPVGGNRTFTTFIYENPHYNRVERMDYGYEKVTTYQHNTDSNDDVYRYTVEEYNNRNFTKRGRKTRDCVYDAAGNPYIEHLYDATVYDFADSIVSENGCAREDLYVGVESDITNWYEGQSTAQLTSRVVRKYDRHRNVTDYIHYGDTTHYDEYFEAHIDYYVDMQHNMVSLPKQIKVRNRAGDILQDRTATYYSTGKLESLTRINNGQTAEYHFSYDSYGNLEKSALPKNNNGESLQFIYEYDNVVHTYPVRVENTSLGYYSTAKYDLKFGKPTKTMDINGNEMLYQYDTLGRTVVITAPYELDTGQPYTIKMEYHPHNLGRIDVWNNMPNPYSYATTYHYDRQHQENPIRTTLITDGFGRLLQTKKDAEIDGHEVNLVTGKVKYDCFGRTLEQYHPFTEDTALHTIYNDFLTTGTATVTTYDIMDRQTSVSLPGDIVTNIDYGFESWGGKTLFRTRTTDPLDNAVTVLKGTMGQQIAQIAPYGHITVFEYDCIGRLTKSSDPDGFATTYKYDMFGQMVHRHHPDAGSDFYEYDPAGNLTRHTNAAGEHLDYAYHYNQLTDILYSQYPENNVHYEYGTAANADINAVGKVILQEDGSGWQTFKYGKLGEVIENIRTFALPFENQPYTFKMQYEYDSWNRIQKMTYPDGEEVHYEYNLGGMLEKMSGNKNGVQYTYIDSIAYNEFELKSAVFYGNGTRTRYEYDTLQRLKRLLSECADGVMQDIYYDYDDVSNITSIDNYAGMLPNGLGGRYRNDYTYDNLYRLGRSEGWWDGNRYLKYDMSMSYFENGRLRHKRLDTETWIDGTPVPVNYVNIYRYQNDNQPNTVTSIDGSHSHEMQWDAKGNMVFHRKHYAGYDRRLCWDEQNRLLGVKDDRRQFSYYQYDANGDRVYKLSGEFDRQNVSGMWWHFYQLDNATLYASPYIVATRHGYTKHYYAENERVASRIGGGVLHGLTMMGNGIQDLLHPELPLHHPSCIPNNDEFIKKCDAVTQRAKEVARCLDSEIRAYAPLESLAVFSDILNEEPDCYWYHTDHLGSSSWITNTDGTPVQHLHYLSWGEDLVRQRHTNYHARYTFSGKEKDMETGYSYFGSRYYSSDLSIWLSVDPQSDKYPSFSPYVYCANNPIKLVDPNGEEVIITGEAAAAFFKEVKKGAKEFGISVKMDKNGKLSAKYTGKGSISKEGQLFLDAVDDRTVKVNINAINNKKGTDSEFMFGGAFGGNELFGETIGGEWVNQFAVAKQTVIPSELNAMDDFYGLPGRTSLHEITEAYQGAKIAMSENIISSETGANNPLYKRSHNNAIPQSGQVYRYFYDALDKPTKTIENAKWIDWNVGTDNHQKNLKTTRIY